MRIAHLAAGAGGMYCGACARDTMLARGLMARGHDVQIIPLYTPLRFDGSEPLPTSRIFLGGVNAYLEQYVPVWRYLPRSIRRALDHPRLLEWVSRFAVSTRAGDLGPMIVSVLRGMGGNHAGVFGELMDYLHAMARPDLVSITNSLLTGVAPEIKRRMGTPIVCGLQGEDTFVNSAPEPFRSQAIEQMRKNAQAVDMFLSPGEAYAATMADFLGVPRERVRVTRVGVDAQAFRADARTRPFPFTVGFLSVITPLKGLDILVDALLRLHQRGRELELAIAGKVLDRSYWLSLVRRLDDAGLADRMRYAGEVTFAQKVRFLHGCSAFCMPSRQPETRAVAALEAQAAGLPVVVPNAGIFPEMLALTQGGVLFEPGNSESLADAIERLMEDPEATLRIGEAAAAGVSLHFRPERLTEETLEAIRDVLGSRV
ncbi:MAG: glycosyltransferase family 4 protein [Chthonomonadales bacterium]|nr:glycosyltransferase family 4 protein [Chthonomonadales bacterium]